MATAIMNSAPLENTALSHHDITRGRLSNIEGNPFAVLDLDALRHGRRDRKGSTTPFALARKHADSISPIRSTTSRSNTNPYETLYVHGETTFYDLPTELRDMVYEEAIGHCQVHGSSSATDTDNSGYCRWDPIVKGHPRISRTKDPHMHMSMLLVSKQVGTEWREFLGQHVPVHLYTSVTLKNLDDSPKFLLGNMKKALPIVKADGAAETTSEDAREVGRDEVFSTFTARGAFLAIDCNATGWAPESGNYSTIAADLHPSEEEFNFHIITSTGFQDFSQGLRLCATLEDLIVHWELFSDWDYDAHPHSQSGTPNMLFESMIQVIEAIPNLKRYLLRCGSYATFASRPAGETWAGDATLRLTHDTKEGYYDGPCEDLYRGLNA